MKFVVYREYKIIFRRSFIDYFYLEDQVIVFYMINIVYSDNDNCCGYIALCYKKYIKAETNVKNKNL